MAVQKIEESSTVMEDKQLPTPPPEPATTSEVEGQQPVVPVEPLASVIQKDKHGSQILIPENPFKGVKSESIASTQTSQSLEKSKDESESKEDKSTQTTVSEETAKKSEDVVKIDKTEDEKKSDDKTDKDEKKSEDSTKSDDDKVKKEGDKKDEDKKEEEEKKELVPRGMKAELKTLWAKTDAQCKCCTTWVEKNPDDGSNVEESDECKQHAVIVRKKKKHEGNRKPLKVDSIVIHSPLLKKVLQKLFAGYPDLVIDLDELVFDSPFNPFFHRWEKFEQLKSDEKDETTKSHLGLLYDALASELKPTIQRYKDLIRHKVIDFEILWTLFPPGDLMYSHDNGHDRLYRTTDCEYWQDLSGMKFTIRCDMIDWDGEKFGKITMSEQISKFKGTKQITSLPSYPLRFHLKAEEMKQKCVERGRRFRELAGTHCKDYKGTAIEYMKFSYQTVTSKRAIEGRIMLDEELFSKFNPDEQQILNELNDEEDLKLSEPEAEEEKKDEKKVEEATKPEDKSDSKSEETPVAKSEKESETQSQEETTAPASETEIKITVTDTSTTPTDSKPEKKDVDQSILEKSDDVEALLPKEEAVLDPEEKPELTENQLAICTSWLRGYSLTYQKWASFAVENISDVVWNEDAFSQLTLPAEYRELILATIQSQIKQNKWKQKVEKAFKKQRPIKDDDPDDDNGAAEFDDFINAKGLGYILLFSGNPGVGKTATAESIAELMHVPLCMVSVGNLGTTAESVESSLQDILELASKWNAVLLLDEADIFLEQRTKHDLHRNAVVSVFLRLLEYYQGVMCLTTNRAEEIDVAFHSRIHISLPFPDLTEQNREQIWRHFAKITNKKAEVRRTPKTVEAAPVNEEIEEPEATHPHGSKTPSSTGIATPATSVSEDVAVHCENANNMIELSASDFRKLAQSPLNGRQIKNAFKTAVLLASYKKEKVQMKHVKTALRTIDGGMGGFGRRGDLGRMYY